jgi:hypothetical protein
LFTEEHECTPMRAHHQDEREGSRTSGVACFSLASGRAAAGNCSTVARWPAGESDPPIARDKLAIVRAVKAPLPIARSRRCVRVTPFLTLLLQMAVGRGRQLIDQVGQMLAQSGKKILASYAGLLAQRGERIIA